MPSPPKFDFEAAWYTWGHIFGTEVGPTMPTIARFFAKHKFRQPGKGFQATRGVARGMRLDIKSYVEALSGERLPISLQLVGHRWQEMALLNVADLAQYGVNRCQIARQPFTCPKASSPRNAPSHSGAGNSVAAPAGFQIRRSRCGGNRWMRLLESSGLRSAPR